MTEHTGAKHDQLWDDFGGPQLCDYARVGVGLALLWETASHRQRIHRARWDMGSGCDARIVVAGVALADAGHTRTLATVATLPEPCGSCGSMHTAIPGESSGAAPRFLLAGDCPCHPLLVDVFLAAHIFLVARGAELRHPAAAARRHISNRQHEYTRQRRGEAGAQVRTDRLARSARGLLLATDEQRRLLEDVAAEAGSEAPLESHSQLEMRLALLRARRLNLDADDLLDDIRRDLAAVKKQYSSGRLVNVGTVGEPELVSWWEAYIERPLGRRGRMSDLTAVTFPHNTDGDAHIGLDLPCPSADAGYQGVLDTLSSSSTEARQDHPVITALSQTALSDRHGDRSRQLEVTLRELAVAGRVQPSVIETFLADPRRRLDAVNALNEVVACF